MSGVRVLVGTRKGAFVLESDGKREKWNVQGPFFAGFNIYHVKGSPVDPNRIYASQSSGWFGQVVQRSNDGGVSWEPVDNTFTYDGVPGTHQWYDGTQHPWEFKRVWSLEPSLHDPDTVYAGVEDAAIFKTTDAGKTWNVQVDKEDVVRSLAISQHALGTREVMVVQHTQCGMHGLDENALALKIEHAKGVPPTANVRFGAFTDLDTSVRASVARLRSTDLLLHHDVIRGFVYDVETGQLREVT